ncbi:MAG: energy-coupling factor ABC transporter ATP-binding protein, partial [Elusimicrobia bacterium]|nr:energy-coupling factor ABC transporter ATP-binding protein [Elusimicrobiota bacterium]
MIKIKNLNFNYPDGTKVFEKFNFTYNGGKIGLIGKNGSGKTTLFHLIMGLLKHQAGEIEIFEKTRKREEDFVEIRRRIGLLFQNPDDQLFCPTVKEEIAFGPLNLGKNKSEALEIVKDVCSLFGLEGYEDKVSFK